MVVWRIRLGVLICVFAAAALAPAAVPASPGSSGAPFEAVLMATSTGGTAWCCGTLTEFAGSGVVTSVGAVDFTGQWLHGCSFPVLPTPCFRRLDLVLSTRNGDRLAIRGNNEWTLPLDAPPGVLTWTSDPGASSGRFAGLVAAGTYTVDDTGPVIRISLVGQRQRGTTGAT